MDLRKRTYSSTTISTTMTTNRGLTFDSLKSGSVLTIDDEFQRRSTETFQDLPSCIYDNAYDLNSHLNQVIPGILEDSPDNEEDCVYLGNGKRFRASSARATAAQQKKPASNNTRYNMNEEKEEAIDDYDEDINQHHLDDESSSNSSDDQMIMVKQSHSSSNSRRLSICLKRQASQSQTSNTSTSKSVYKSILKSSNSRRVACLASIPDYRILPIDFDDLPVNEFHLYSDIVVSLQNPSHDSTKSSSAFTYPMQVPSQNKEFDLMRRISLESIEGKKQMNFICQWKSINSVQDTKREMKFSVSNKTETCRNFGNIIRLLKRNENQAELGKLLIMAEAKVDSVQQRIRDSFRLMRENNLMGLYQERRAQFEKKCEYFLKEMSSQKKYLYVKSTYNEEKCEIEDTEVGISSKIVELLTTHETSLMTYKILRGIHPEIFGSRTRELCAKLSAMRLLAMESNTYNEVTCDNMELVTIDGFVLPVSLTIKRNSFSYEQKYANLPLEDKFVVIEVHISPKVMQQFNKIRKDIKEEDISSPKSNEQIDINHNTQIDEFDLSQKVSSTPITNPIVQIEDLPINQPKISESMILEQRQQEQEEEDKSKSSQKPELFQEIIYNSNNNNKNINDDKSPTEKTEEKNEIKKAIPTLKALRKRKLPGFIDDNQKDFYYELQSQVFLDRFYDKREIQELIQHIETFGQQKFPIISQPN